MIHSGLKKWEIAACGALAAAAVIVAVLESAKAVKISDPLKIIVLMAFAAALMSWRSVYTLIKLSKLKRDGSRAAAFVSGYRKDIINDHPITVEIIQYKDESGKIRKKDLYEIYMIRKKVGRTYTLYYDSANEDNFILMPQSLISIGINLLYTVFIEAFLFIVLRYSIGG